MEPRGSSLCSQSLLLQTILCQLFPVHTSARSILAYSPFTFRSLRCSLLFKFQSQNCLGLNISCFEEYVLLVVTPYSSERARRFGGIYHLYIRGRSVGYARNQQKHNLLLPVSWFAYSSATNIEAICSSETSGSLSEPHCVTVQKIILFTVTTVRSLCPTLRWFPHACYMLQMFTGR
jgi:hypothetical protein